MNLKSLLQYESGKQAFFELLSQYPKNWQCNTTPMSIVKKMVDKTEVSNKKILVLFNIEFLEVLINEKKVDPKNIYYVADNHLEMLTAKKVYKVNSYCSPYEDGIEGLKKLIKSI